MTVQDVLNTVKAGNNYVTNSLVIKSSDAGGVVYKYLETNDMSIGIRREIFIATEVGEVLEERVVITNLEIVPAD